MRKIDLTNFQVATSETARQINRRIALNIIRRSQPMSRADLARRSGMQRSTVSAIVEQLIDEGWVTEGASGPSTRGRRPRLLHLNVERAGIVAVDLRPETTRVALAGIDARFVMQSAWPTPASPEAFAKTLAGTVESFGAARQDIVCEGVGVSVPGRVNDAGELVFAPNLGWGQVNLRKLLESEVGLPLALENAASACALAELWFGRHPENVRDLVAVTVSEGIGVGLLLNGQLVRGGGAMAGEFGHVVLDERGTPCACGRRGCWEQFASNQAAVRHYLGRSAPKRNSGRRAARSLQFTDILALADGGERRAVATLERMAYYLGLGISGLVTGLAPQLLVIVGEVTAAWSRVGPIIVETVSSRTLPGTSTAIVPTDAGTQPRLRGAVTLVVQQHFGAPNVA
ncbi:MAG: ROK family transcriptional regulator [Acidobacteria bacterium]|nr:ROK family transcriptional regulator [Acidobacteriota bacterium]